MPFVSQLYFKTAVVFFLVGLGMGLHMAISGDHSVIGAHAHANLLGWVTSAVFGAYFALNPEKAQGRLPMVQYGVYVGGVVVMTPALYFMLLGNPGLEPLVAVASLVAFAGVLLFGYIVFTPARRTTLASAEAGAAE